MELPRLWRGQRTLLLTMMMFKLGFLCTTAAADRCLSSPCLNGATCLEAMGDYVCLCPRTPTWFTGPHCEDLHDPCSDPPCSNCTSVLGSGNYTCHCPEGLTGPNCTEDQDECLHQPCEAPRSLCVNVWRGYTCHCPLGSGGTDCQDRTSTCADRKCQNGGVCEEEPEVGARCLCLPGYDGAACERDVNECVSAPCRNGALCQDRVDGYQCFCVPGFQGSHCDLDINECASKPCRNNGTCLDLVDRYECECAPGYTGVNCEVEVDECETGPCQNGASCLDLVARYQCQCVPGFEGPDCEVDIDECYSAPCLHHGVCVDRVNRYECVCDGTGFLGLHCEEDIPECASDPCQNGATCLDGVNQFYCQCWAGYEGDHCEVDIDECQWEPCDHGGQCFQRSDVLLYDRLPELSSSSFSFADALGFICRCQPGYSGENCSVNVDECESEPCLNRGHCEDQVNAFSCLCAPGYTGVQCEVDINECDSAPCQNQATCEDAVASYRCHCPAPSAPGQDPWGGPDCGVRLVGCHSHQCQNQASCSPSLSQDGAHTYSCLCRPGWSGELCNTSTTFSFRSEGYVLMATPGFSNKSKLADARGEMRGEMHVQLRFRTTLPDMVLFFRGSVENYMFLEVVGGLLRAKVKSGKVYQTSLSVPATDGEWWEVSVTMEDKMVMTVKGPGCEDGCKVKNEGYVFLQPALFKQMYIGGGPPQFLSRTVSGRGYVGCMEDLYVDHKPLLPQDLLREESRALELGCTKEEWCEGEACGGRGECVDLWVRAGCLCTRPYYGESCEREYLSWTFGSENGSSFAAFTVSEFHGENFNVSFLLRSLQQSGLILQLRRREKPYLSVFLKDGAVALYSPHTTLLSEAKDVANGNSSLITVRLQLGHVVFPNAGNRRALGNVTVEAGDVAFLGGLPPEETLSPWEGPFRGCLQDVRIDHRHVTSTEEAGDGDYPLALREHVLDGCHSDDTCKSAPCLNGGVCEVTWNDFRCTCLTNFCGRICETRLWCEDRPCVPGSRCVDLPDGYECLTEANFQDNSLQYAANGSLLGPITSISLDLRTRDQDGILLRADTRSQGFCLGLLNSTLLVKMDGGSGSELLAFTSEHIISDGAWHSVQVAMADPDMPTSRWRLTVDGHRAGTSFASAPNLNFLNSSQIWLAEKYTGCLGEVRIAGVYLPLLRVPEVPQQSRFLRLSGHEPDLGCTGAPVCDSQPCLNDGVCWDQFNQFNCSCAPGWGGAVCGQEVDECEGQPCVYGTCKDLMADYSCDCERGYSGKNCEHELDDCREFICEHGGVCAEREGVHTCSCPEGYTGKRCQWRYPPVSCDADRPCENSGVCVGGAAGGNCTCKPGYTGSRCETEIDECVSGPCLNGGTCLDRLNRFQCVCAPGFSGRFCDSTKEEQMERVPWLAVTIPVITLCVLLAVLAVFFLAMTARKKRQSEGTYSPSCQEVAGARLEMGSVLKVPPEERLI